MIITLTTDMGISDFYVASIKGSILKELPDVNIIDISHVIRPFDILHASFVIKRTLKDGETASASKVYISTTEATATKYDFVPLDMQLIEFKKADLENTIKVETKEDALTDADEYFYLDLF